MKYKNIIIILITTFLLQGCAFAPLIKDKISDISDNKDTVEEVEQEESYYYEGYKTPEPTIYDSIYLGYPYGWEYPPQNLESVFTRIYTLDGKTFCTITFMNGMDEVKANGFALRVIGYTADGSSIQLVKESFKEPFTFESDEFLDLTFVINKADYDLSNIESIDWSLSLK